MTMKSCCICDKEYEKTNFYNKLYTNNNQLKTATKTKFKRCKKIYNTEKS